MTRRGTSLLLAVAIVVLAATACTSESESESEAQAGTTTSTVAEAPSLVEFPAPDSGVLISYAVPEDRLRVEPDPEKGTIDFELRECRWEWPGRVVYELSWTPPDDLDLPATIRLRLTQFSGDTGSGFTVDAVLSGPGDFSLLAPARETPTAVVTAGSAALPEAEKWSATRQDALAGIDTDCGLDVESVHPVEIADRGLSVIQNGVAPTITASDGTVEELLALIDPDDPDDPLLPLAALYLDPTWPDIDRLWIAPTLPLSSIQILSSGTCLTVATRYVEARVSQRFGCPGRSAGSGLVPVVGIEDEVWEVSVAGPEDEVRDLIAAVAVVPFDGVEPFEPIQFDANSYLDAWYEQRSELVEVGRAAWQGGQVSVSVGTDQLTDERIQPNTKIVLPDDPLNAGERNTPCRDFATVEIQDIERGFLAVISSPEIVRAEYLELSNIEVITAPDFDMEQYLEVTDWLDIPLDNGRSGYNFGFVGGLPLPESGIGGLIQTRFFDSDGNEMACIQ